MSTKTVKYWRNKAVIVSVYVERPRRKRPPSANNHNDHDHHHHHHHYVHYGIKQEVTLRKPDAGKGYDRRAELLLYSQRLRESARLALDVAAVHPSLEPEPKPKPKLKSTSTLNLQPASNIVAVETKPKLTRTTGAPACLGNWKICFPSFLRSLTSPQSKKPKKKKKHNGSTSNAMKAVMKGIEMPKKKGFISKILSTLRMHR